MTPGAGNGVLAVAAARLAHEIRNSLAGIAGALDVLSERLPKGPELDEVMARVRGEVARIDGAVSELSVFTRAPSPVLKRRSLHTIIDRALEAAVVKATTRVAREYSPGVGAIPLDDKLLGDALGRLFRNAAEAMPAGGLLTIETRTTEAAVEISVRDSGRGIREQDLEALFEPFYSSKTRGLGLGLAIARRLIEAQGGTLSAAALSEKGAEFTIRLPASR